MPLIQTGTLRFDQYEIDRARWQLTWCEKPVALNRKTFDLLIYLIDRRERVVGKEELLQALWPEQFVEESNLTQHVFLLRKALSRHESEIKIIETVPGRGYRFAAEVSEDTSPMTGQVTIAATESITRITIQEEETFEEHATGREALDGFTSRRGLRVAALAAVAAVVVAAGWLGWQSWLDHSGGAPVQVVVVPFEGTTGDAVLDKSLSQALRMDLAQSPYVTLVPISTVGATLTQMLHKPGDQMTAAMAREVCERTNSQSVLSGSIAKVGQHFLITEEANNCVDGSSLGSAKHEALQPEDLPHAIDLVAARLRQKLGESRRSIARFNMPLLHDNTASLDALKAFTQGTQAIREGRLPEAIALLKTSAADDPQFAAAQFNLAAAYGTAGDDKDLRESIAKAYTLKDSASKTTQFSIETMYDSEYTGDAYELVRHFESWVALYPNSSQAWSGLANAQRTIGLDSEALVSSRRTIELLPHSQGMLANLAMDQTRNHDLEGSRATCERAIHDNLDGDGIRVRYLQLAYLLRDQQMLRAQRAWAEAHPQSIEIPIMEIQIAMAEGRFVDAQRMLERLRGLHRQQGLSGPDDERVKFGAVGLMETGDLEAGKKIFQQSPVDIEEGQEVLGLAYTGDFPAAEAALRANELKYPLATMWKLYWGPAVEATIAVAQHRPGDAAAALETARPLDRTGPMLPWLRGNAYLAAGKPSLAEVNYRGVIDHPEIDPASPAIPLSWLGLGEALAAEGKRPAAVEAYKKFFELWAHADPDAVYLKRAKEEFARLQAA